MGIPPNPAGLHRGYNASAIREGFWGAFGPMSTGRGSVQRTEPSTATDVNPQDRQTKETLNPNGWHGRRPLFVRLTSRFATAELNSNFQQHQRTGLRPEAGGQNADSYSSQLRGSRFFCFA